MKTKHTPGKWEIKTPNNSEYEIKSEYGHVCTIYGRGTIEAESNAELIAAAPELLEALKKCAKWIMNNCPGDYENTPWRDAANAIKKSTI